MPKPYSPSTWSHLRGFQEWPNAPSLINLGGKNPSRALEPPVGAPKHRDPWQDLCRLFLMAAASGSAGDENSEFCSDPQEGIPVVWSWLSS